MLVILFGKMAFPVYASKLSNVTYLINTTKYYIVIKKPLGVTKALNNRRPCGGAVADMASKHHEVPELSETQIVNIQEQYRLAVHLGRHGIVNTEFTLCLPTDKEYDAAAEVVESMHVNDVLFLESRGHDATRFTANSVTFLPRIERLREQHKISAWHYAKYLAQRKGCTVLPADLTKEENREYGHLDFASLSIRRESKAVRTVIDFALNHPRQKSADSPGQPTLHLMFGSGHSSGFRRAFRRTGLGSSVEFDRMPHSSLLGHLSQTVALRRKKD